MWFQDDNGDGIVFPEYFTPIPTRAIAFALTVVRMGLCAALLQWTLTTVHAVVRSSAVLTSGLMARAKHPIGTKAVTKPFTIRTSLRLTNSVIYLKAELS